MYDLNCAEKLTSYDINCEVLVYQGHSCGTPLLVICVPASNMFDWKRINKNGKDYVVRSSRCTSVYLNKTGHTLGHSV